MRFTQSELELIYQYATPDKVAVLTELRAMREEIKAVEKLKKTAEQLARSEQAQKKEEHEL